MKNVLLILSMDVSLVVLAGMFDVAGRNALALSILAAVGGLAVWQVGLFVCVPLATRMLRVTNGVRLPHFIQGLVQVCLYIYWGLYWDDVAAYAPLILVQLVFAYAFEMLLCWSRYRVWRAGFGPVPVVLSINLFLWFREEYFGLQLAVIAAVYLCKEFITSIRDGRRRHVFNPSAFPLALTAVALMSTSTVGLTTGVDLIISFALPPHFFEVVLLLGLVVQLLFGTAPVTLGAAVALVGLDQAAKLIVGGPIAFTPIDPSVFIGITLLVTDPATTPQSLTGKWLFGLCYGTGIFGAFILLRYLQQPGYFDKILVVPAVNLMVPVFERWGTRIGGWVLIGRITRIRPQYGAYASIVLLGCVVVPLLPPLTPAILRNFVDPLPPDPNVASDQMDNLFFNRIVCQVDIFPEVYEPFMFKAEATHFGRVKKILYDPRLHKIMNDPRSRQTESLKSSDKSQH